jgi:hypothetical protein
MKEKELKDMLKNYESMKNKLTETKKKLTEKRDHSEQIRKTNFNLKKMISGVIKFKHDK